MLKTKSLQVFAWRLFVQVDDLLSVQDCEWGDCKSERMHFVIDMIVARWHYRGVWAGC